MAEPVWVDPILAHQLYGVACQQAWLVGTSLVYMTANELWVEMSPV